MLHLSFSTKYMLRALLAVLMFPAAGAGYAADLFPVRPLRMLVGYPAGGPNDITARITAEYLSNVLGQQVIVDNRAGAGGTISATILSQAAPDGYTLGLCANGEMAIAPNLRLKMPYDPLRDFAPVSRVGAGHLALVVPVALPAKTTADFVGLAKAKPGALNFASSGTGSTAHLAGELFKAMAKIDIVHVPYKGAAPALADVIGAQVQMLITGYSGVVPHARAGRLRVLAVTGAQRLKAAPEVPTIGEALPGYEVNSWYGVFAPAATPRALLERFQREIAAMTRTPAVIARMVALGIEPEGNTGKELAEQMKQEIAKWRKVVEVAGVAKE
ncbi:MAG: tripartite tricarboxylate transporter substrate binding protein [Burkholderiales bacterium]|nr:tripartite tricarboxylate transporter substrate binding protein [Burkholderiales bacterium]